MAFSKAFDHELNSLFRHRTHWLRQELGTKKTGKPPRFSRKKVDAGIRKLQTIASKALAHKMAKSEFVEHVASRKNYYVKGRGPNDKKKKFEKWFAANFRRTKGLIYAFWGNQKKCIYVGRTGSHGSRPSSHFEKFWFSGVKRVTIFAVSGNSHIPKLDSAWMDKREWKRPRNPDSYDCRYRIPDLKDYEDKWQLISDRLATSSPDQSLESTEE
jgi:hypothetical protein